MKSIGIYLNVYIKYMMDKYYVPTKYNPSKLYFKFHKKRGFYYLKHKFNNCMKMSIN